MKTTSIALCLFFIVTAGLVGVSRRIEAAPQTTDGVPTFTRDVAPILYANCVTCHRPGEIGPMSLLSYQDVRPWARSIAKKVDDGVKLLNDPVSVAEVQSFFADHPIEQATKTLEQILERQRVNPALRQRDAAPLAAELRAD